MFVLLSVEDANLNEHVDKHAIRARKTEYQRIIKTVYRYYLITINIIKF